MRFNPETDQDLEDFHCSCPAVKLCVHKAVAWIGWLYQATRPEQEPSAFVANNLLPEAQPNPATGSSLTKASVLPDFPLAEDEPEEQALDQPQEDARALVSPVLETLAKAFGLKPLEKGSSTEQWLPLLCLAPEESIWQVRLALVLVKKDGSHGRIKDWRPGQLHLTPRENESYWVDVLARTGGSMDLDRFHLLQKTRDPLPFPTLYSITGLAYTRIGLERISLFLEPRIDSWGPQHIRWHGRIEVEDQQGLMHRVQQFQAGTQELFFMLEGTGLACCQQDPKLAAVLKMTSGSTVAFNQADIKALESIIEDNKIPMLNLCIRGRTCSQVRSRGQARLQLSLDRGIWGKGPDLTIIRFSVDWDIHETQDSPGSRDESWLRHMELDGDHAILHERDLDWEGRVLYWLERELASRLDRLEDNHGAFYREPESTDNPRSGSYRAIPPPGPRAKLRQLDEGRDLYWKGSPTDFLESFGVALMEAGFSLALEAGAPPSAKGSVQIRIDHGLDWLDLEPGLTIKATSGSPGSRKRAARKARQPSPQRKVELLAVQDLLRHRFLKDHEGRLILLSPEDRDKLQKLLQSGVALNGTTRLSTRNITALACLPEEETATIPAVLSAREVLTRLRSMDHTLLLDPAPGFKGTLRGYQRHGYSWLYHHCKAGLGACLADDMGLGKTVQTLALLHRLNHEHQGPGTFCALLVVPVSTQANWEQECSRFTPELALGLHSGPRRPTNKEELEKAIRGRQLTLVSYATLRSDIELFGNIPFSVLVLDEAQQIKNPDSLIFKAVSSLQATSRITLTGTPVENSVFDLWSQMDFLNPGILGSLKKFRSRFAFGIEEREDPQALDDLRRVSSPFLLRRRKDEVATELPPREESIIYCELGPEQRRIYQDILDACRLKVDEAIRKNGISKAGITILESLLRLRQACLFPGLINPAWSTCPSSKLEVFSDLALELAQEDHKALVFSQFTGVLDQLEHETARLKLASVRLDGSSTGRGQIIDSFNNNENCRLFLLSLKAGGLGINLTSADYVILFDPWWNPAAEAQAIDRAHRIGQTKSVFVYRLITRDTVEEKILTLQGRKKDLATSLFSQGDEAIATSSPEDLLALLG